jgi:Ni/Fe-hydrogenase subunit HybB-like protein
MQKPKLGFWKATAWVVAVPAVAGLILRLTGGLGASTNLSDDFPWGLWIGFKLFAVALAGGGFTLAAVVYIFNIERYRPVLRPMILTALLGYSMFVVSLVIDLGRPYRIWHPIVMWNDRSVMFEIAWCVMLYTTVLSLEFLPVVLERLQWKRQLRWMHAVMVPLVVAGVILSTLHQSSLGSLYLIVPDKLYPLWYSPMQPVFFFVSSIAAGLAMVIFEAWHANNAFHKLFPMHLLAGLARVQAVILAFYLSLRVGDLLKRNAMHFLLVRRPETYLFMMEMGLLTVPMLLLFRRRILASRTALYLCSVVTLLGIITNRMNVAITGMEASAGVHYFPKWSELTITLGLIAAAFTIFWYAAKYLPVFPDMAGSPARPVEETVQEFSDAGA